MKNTAIIQLPHSLNQRSEQIWRNAANGLCIPLQPFKYQQQKEAIDPEPSFRLLKKCFLTDQYLP